MPVCPVYTRTQNKELLDRARTTEIDTICDINQFFDLNNFDLKFFVDNFLFMIRIFLEGFFEI